MQRKNLKKLALNLPPVSFEKNRSDDNSFTKEHYSNGPACILPNLYLGAHVNALDLDTLTKHGINCIINVASEISNIPLTQQIEYHHIQWTHYQSNLAQSEFGDAIQIIIKAHNQNKTVLVHCQQGIERSATLVLAFLLYSRTGSTLEQMMEFVKVKAPGICPNMELWYQLKEYEEMLQKKDHIIQSISYKPDENPHTQFGGDSKHYTESSGHSTYLISTHYSTHSLTNSHILAIASLLVLLTAIHQQKPSYSSTLHQMLHQNNMKNNKKKFLNSHFIKSFYIM